jgi:hypothetical protein
MSLDDMFAKADAVSSRAGEEAEERARQAEAAANAQRVISDQFRAWTGDAVRRLGEAGVPQQTAARVGDGTDESPAMGLLSTAPRQPRRRSLRDFFLGSSSDTPAAEPRTSSPGMRTQEVGGWIIYSCTERTPDYPYGSPCRALAIPGESLYMRDSVVGSSKSRQALFLTSDGSAYVAKVTIRTREGSDSPPEYTLEPSADDEFEPWLGLVGRDATTLQANELYMLSGLGHRSHPWDPYAQTREEYRQDQELIGQRNEQTSRDQLVHWELGVRYILGRHAAGLPTT